MQHAWLIQPSLLKLINDPKFNAKLMVKISLKRLVVSFSGSSNMRFITPASLKGESTVSIRLTIRPDIGNGIIIYAEKVGHNKFFGLALKDTYLELR